MPHILFPHQQDALTRIRDNPRPALFMQMRLGKTPVIIRWAKRNLVEGNRPDHQRRALVVGPMSVLDDWEVELRREGIRPIVRLDGRSRQERNEWLEGGQGWYLINYEGVRVSSEITDMEWDVVIADESTAIRNPQAQITKVMQQFVHVPYRAILTGDPAPEGPMDYFSQFMFLHGNFMNYGNFWVWRNAKFKQSPWAKWDWQPKPGTRDEIKAYVHQRAVVMTRAQLNIGGAFRPVQRRFVELNSAQRDAIKQIKKNFQYEYVQTNFATVRDVWLARIAGGFSPDQLNPELLSNAKTDELVRLLKGELAHEPVVVWFRFNEELEHVVNTLNKTGIHAVGVTGSVPKTRRYELRKDFARGQFRIICVQVKLGRFGWDLSHARTAIRYSNAYDLESYSQSRDRIVHPTKKDPLLEIHLITRGTLDEDVVKLLQAKHRNSKQFMRALNQSIWERYWKEQHAHQKGGSRTSNQETQKIKVKVRRLYPGS